MAGLPVVSDQWIRRYQRGQAGAPEHRTPRLVCFPHAGGAASYFLGLSRLLSPATEVLAVQYPGRQDRRAEPALDDIHALADGISAALAPWADEPLAYFGHSMGAAVAFEVARRLPPRVLFASGRRAPTSQGGEQVHLMDDEGLLAEVATLSGTDTRVLDDPEMRALILPALRADYRAIETYVPGEDAVLEAPIEVLIGDRDPRVTEAQAKAWSVHTTGDFDLHVFPGGGHFYVADFQEELADLLARRIGAITA